MVGWLNSGDFTSGIVFKFAGGNDVSIATASRRGGGAAAFLVLDELDFLSDFLSSFFLSSGFFYVFLKQTIFSK